MLTDLPPIRTFRGQSTPKLAIKRSPYPLTASFNKSSVAFASTFRI